MIEIDDPAFPDILIASAARFLIDGLEEDAASALLTCRPEIRPHQFYEEDLVSKIYNYDLIFYCPRASYDMLMNCDDPTGAAVTRAVMAVLPDRPQMRDFLVRAELVAIDPGWRAELLEIARGMGVHNQLADASQARIRTWRNLRFRSQSEVRVASALDASGAFFLPNCMGRLGSAGARLNREADFLVCHQGKWGILEVDGEPFHPPSRTVQDHERDRLFKAHGVRCVEHFDASECFENAAGVVARFLDLLGRS